MLQKTDSDPDRFAERVYNDLPDDVKTRVTLVNGFCVGCGAKTSAIVLEGDGLSVGFLCPNCRNRGVRVLKQDPYPDTGESGDAYVPELSR